MLTLWRWSGACPLCEAVAEAPTADEEAPTAEDRPQRAGLRLARKLLLAPEKRDRDEPEMGPAEAKPVAPELPEVVVGVPERLPDPPLAELELKEAAVTQSNVSS